MNVELIRAGSGEKPVLGRMMAAYLRELSAVRDEIAADEETRSSYPYFELYWSEPERHPYLIRHGETVVGFALVRVIEHSCYEMAEFFIVPEHRRAGLGASAVCALFELYEGTWQVTQQEENVSATAFWRKVISRFSGDRFREDRSAQQPSGPMQSFKSGCG